VVNATGDSIGTTAGTSLNVTGGNDSFGLGANNYLGLLGGSGYVVNATGDSIGTLNNVSFTVSGNSNIIAAGAGSTVSVVGASDTVNASSDTVDVTAGTNVTLNGSDDSLSMAPGSSAVLYGIGNSVDGIAVGAGVSGITETITSNSDGTWTDLLQNTGNQVSWSEEQFIHAANNELAEETTIYTNGSDTVQYWDVYGDTQWSTDIKQYNSSVSLTSDTVDNNDGTSAITDYYGSGVETYFYRPGNSGSDWTAIVNSTLNGVVIGGSSGDIYFLDPGEEYYSDWSGGAMGSDAGDDAVDDIFASGPPSFNYNAPADDGLSGIDIIDPNDVDLPSDLIVDPLVLNLAGGPVVTTSSVTNGIAFDMRGDGSTQSTGWITPNEGFLVLETQNTGPITSSHDMISDLNELASFDSNGDGKITAADALFGDLEVWIPGAQGSPGALETLTQLGISEIDLSATTANRADNGNTINATFSFKYADGATGQGADVSFAVGPDEITLGGTVGTVTLESNETFMISGSGTIVNAGTADTVTLAPQNTLTITAGLSLVADVTSAGTIQLASGDLTMQAVTNYDTFQLGGTATLNFVSSVASGDEIQFLQPGGTLETPATGPFGAQIAGFATGDVIDAAGVLYGLNPTLDFAASGGRHAHGDRRHPQWVVRPARHLCGKRLSPGERRPRRDGDLLFLSTRASGSRNERVACPNQTKVYLLRRDAGNSNGLQGIRLREFSWDRLPPLGGRAPNRPALCLPGIVLPVAD